MSTGGRTFPGEVGGSRCGGQSPKRSDVTARGPTREAVTSARVPPSRGMGLVSAVASTAAMPATTVPAGEAAVPGEAAMSGEA